MGAPLRRQSCLVGGDDPVKLAVLLRIDRLAGGIGLEPGDYLAGALGVGDGRREIRDEPLDLAVVEDHAVRLVAQQAGAPVRIEGVDEIRRDVDDLRLGHLTIAGPGGIPVLQDPPPPTQQDQINANTAAIQAELDRQARLKGYDNILSACTYAAQPQGAAFQAEGAAFLAWRADVWQQAYATLAQVKAGTASMPTPSQAVAAMPALVLPS